MSDDIRSASPRYDVIIIGAGISGLTAASLLARRGLRTAVIDKGYNPGGSCGILKRENVTFDQGAAMLFGFGEKGFNSHRFVFNCLEEPIDIIKHDALYCVNYSGKRIIFRSDVRLFADELAKLFPLEKENILLFYKDLGRMYQHVMVENPTFSTPDEVDPKAGLRQLIHHPVSYARFLMLINKSTRSLLSGYFKDPEVYKFFDKLTSTYCYTTVEETPAILAAVMFVDNHVGGSYYPAGSTVFLPGKLEKVIEENNGVMLMQKEVIKILFADAKPAGVELKTGEKLYADNIIYSGNVWSLYKNLLDPPYVSPERAKWAEDLVPTYPSVVLYAYVDKEVIPEDTLPIEMLVGNPDQIDESEVTVYIFSIDDKTLCPEDGHVITAIGPTFENWETKTAQEYAAKKELEKIRLSTVLEKRFPGFQKAIRYAEVATPRTLARYANKYGGSVAGPRQMLGQHMFNRLHTRSEWDTLFYCGESTVMGTGTPSVTVSGLSAANAILQKKKLTPYIFSKDMKNYVNIVRHPFHKEDLYQQFPAETREIMQRASRCHFCEDAACMKDITLNIRGIMRRVTVGNFVGAGNMIESYFEGAGTDEAVLSSCESYCIQNMLSGSPVEIREIVRNMRKRHKAQK